MGRIRVFLLILCFIATGIARSAFAAGTDDTASPDPDKALGAGDTVNFAIAEDKTPPVKLRVTDAGLLQVPYIGNVSAAGKSCSELAVQIKRQLEAKYYYKATVALSIDVVAPIKLLPPKKVSVSGKVVSPGLVEFASNETLRVSQAIAKAGNTNQFGTLSKVTLKRRNADGTTTTYHLNLDLNKGNPKDDLELQDGDSIDVGAKLINFGN